AGRLRGARRAERESLALPVPRRAGAPHGEARHGNPRLMKKLTSVVMLVLAVAWEGCDQPPPLTDKVDEPRSQATAVEPAEPRNDRASQRQIWRDDLEGRQKANGRNLEVIVGWLNYEADDVYEMARRDTAQISSAELDARISAYAPLVDELAAF